MSAIYPLSMKPGIKRDGTSFSRNNWNEGEWCRFQRGLPRKMGGYILLTTTTRNPRGIFVVPQSPNLNVYVGDSDRLQYFTINQDGVLLAPFTDRTPVLFNADPNNDWNFSLMFSDVDNGNILVAHAAPTLSSIDNPVSRPIYYGPANAATPLTPTGFSTAGGICVLHPYLFIFDSDGGVRWTNPNDPTTEKGSARVTALKIVAGLPARGGNSSPAGLLWSLDSLIRVTFVGGLVDFTFDTITTESSILSSKGIIEYDGLYFWAAIDRFLVYNGTVKEVPNDMNLNFFFQNLNFSQRQKVWATKIPEFGEIWWFFPMGAATECNHAVVLNVREGTWYNTPISRGDGYFDQVFADPIWSSNESDIFGEYSIWAHENGLDQNVNGTLTAIRSSIVSSDIAYCASSPDGKYRYTDRWVELHRIEPDFIQSGNMTVLVSGKEFARSPVAPDPEGARPFTPLTEMMDFRIQRRQMTLQFESNEVGGDFQMGQILLTMKVGDGRQ